MDFPQLEPLVSLHSRVLDFAAGVLLGAVGDDECPRCAELADGSGSWRSVTEHLHSGAEQARALLAAYQAVNEPELRAWAQRRQESDRLHAAIGRKQGKRTPERQEASLRAWTSREHWASVIGSESDPLGPLGSSLIGSPLSRWQAAENARRAAVDARKASTGSQDRVWRNKASTAASRRDSLEPQVRAWHAEASAAWASWQADLERADELSVPVPSLQPSGGISWH